MSDTQGVSADPGPIAESEQLEYFRSKTLEDIHSFFGLSYASYLTLPRSVLQSMPEEWQHKFVELLHELGSAAEKAGFAKHMDATRVFQVRRVKGRFGNKFIKDPLCDYDRGRRNVFEEDWSGGDDASTVGAGQGEASRGTGVEVGAVEHPVSRDEHQGGDGGGGLAGEDAGARQVAEGREG